MERIWPAINVIDPGRGNLDIKATKNGEWCGLERLGVFAYVIQDMNESKEGAYNWTKHFSATTQTKLVLRGVFTYLEV